MTISSSAQTIFAPASPIQKSGVAIIRISGEGAAEALRALTGASLPAPRSASLKRLYTPHDKQLLDHALTLWFPAPHSFTGEDTVELHTHGSIAVITSLLETLGKMDGLRLAEPGEFSKRAFENQKMDLTEAEGLADLIEAETSLQARQALTQMEGSLHQLYQSWRDQLIKMQALLEAYIDFPDEDIPENVLNDIHKSHELLQENIRSHLSDNHRGERLRRGLQVVIMGPPNAGKSSLLNLLAQRDVAIVSDTAGTTRDILDVHLDIGGYPITLSDTAGLRENAEDIEQEGIRRARSRAGQADLKLLMLDATNDTQENQQLLQEIDDSTLILWNKIDQSDKPPKQTSTPHIAISVKEHLGIDQLIGKLKEHAMSSMGNDQSNAPIVTRSRHRQLLTETLNALAQFSPQKDLILAAEDLRLAAYALGRITGRIDVEDILDELFSQFCIGK